ncbi:VWA domain-containing protein [Tenacibaculum maritimum]|uniref:VWA domain-containing protein n=1 Tax=Tenacibaculum maritimum TaxID=107401 RepID=UPI001E3BCFBD|nr:VWA domain-containing protein [Tenacibaculum maritimum]MCD9563048.1 VWA domain-containing protein [Tenacibaculum maritimum]MCD9566766.1 VWA domain-containing protein [Tenacibaculum maritimum]MCD9577947.1 VWA domain-containing protein [Tenacibaculum maritimum]MCD9596844.1 VWA domain-containing protein [Tenacibaculum maritimum]MCD9614232.1 VWA domain-containing protein [Tenacibaculum maritimum]
METTILLYLFVAFLVSTAIAFFQYFYKNKDQRKVNILLFSLKLISLFLLFVLFINPKITTKTTKNKKPVLAVAIDNSLSIKHFKETEKAKKIIEEFKKSKALNSKFEVNYFAFDEDIKTLDSLSFDKNQTNISQAIQSINNLYENDLGAIIMLTDGNQTIGNDYEFIASKQSIYPIALGDTTAYNDIKIARLNVNKYSYIKNKFPVEVMLYYEGKEKVTTKFSIYRNEKNIYSEKIYFTPQNNTKTIRANLISLKEGIGYYKAVVGEISKEKNTKNNYKNFSVEVIDKQLKIGIVTSINHPDLGALKKAIEVNKQRKVEILDLSKKNNYKNDYQLLILYQPNNKFKNLFEWLNAEKLNYMIVSGAQTDWGFLNKQQSFFTKNTIQKLERYGGGYNDRFLTFQQKNIGFNGLPPLQDKFGEITAKGVFQPLLFQKISGILTKQPLLATFEENNQKITALFGEGIWRWRASLFRKENTFEEFDAFIGNIVQYLSTNKKRARLEVEGENLYPANSVVNISAFYLDKNYQFDNRASLQLTLTNKATKSIKRLPMSLVGNSYQVSIESLAPGNYSYQVSVANQQLKVYGRFKITDYEVEEQFVNGNNKKLKALGERTKGKLFYPSQVVGLKEKLIADRSFYTTQKEIKTTQNLIDWEWILLFIATLLATEWFIRKYYGKI